MKLRPNFESKLRRSFDQTSTPDSLAFLLSLKNLSWCLVKNVLKVSNQIQNTVQELAHCHGFQMITAHLFVEFFCKACTQSIKLSESHCQSLRETHSKTASLTSHVVLNDVSCLCPYCPSSSWTCVSEPWVYHLCRLLPRLRCPLGGAFCAKAAAVRMKKQVHQALLDILDPSWAQGCTEPQAPLHK